MMAAVALGACGVCVAVEQTSVEEFRCRQQSIVGAFFYNSKPPASELSLRGIGYYWLLGVVVGDGVAASVAGGARTMFQISIGEDSKISIANSQ